MRARSMNHGEIARELQVSRPSITSDIQYLRNQAKESIKEYVTGHLPEQDQSNYIFQHQIIATITSIQI
jgi:Mn-dependent DtxR family transcriptional regulator